VQRQRLPDLARGIGTGPAWPDKMLTRLNFRHRAANG
jgi:hypothetical protein